MVAYLKYSGFILTTVGTMQIACASPTCGVSVAGEPSEAPVTLPQPATGVSQEVTVVLQSTVVSQLQLCPLPASGSPSCCFFDLAAALQPLLISDFSANTD